MNPEAFYREKFYALFARVEAHQPEKGFQTLLQRAQAKAKSAQISLEVALEAEYQAAVVRTERRVQLLFNLCDQGH